MSLRATRLTAMERFEGALNPMSGADPARRVAQRGLAATRWAARLVSTALLSASLLAAFQVSWERALAWPLGSGFLLPFALVCAAVIQCAQSLAKLPRFQQLTRPVREEVLVRLLLLTFGAVGLL